MFKKKEQSELYNALKVSLETKTSVSIQYIVDGTLYPAVAVSQLSEPYLSTQSFESVNGVCQEKEGYAVDIEGTFTIQYINGKQETRFCESEQMFLDDWRFCTNDTFLAKETNND